MEAMESVLACVSDWSGCASFARSKKIHIHGRTFYIVRLLGEGGFSYVYLVNETASNQDFALKKIRCTIGEESVQVVMKEVEASNMFCHETIIKIIDHEIVQESDGSKSVYLLLPYYRRGNLQELIDASRISGNILASSQILSYAKDICAALSHMHGSEINQDLYTKAEDDRQDLEETSRLIDDDALRKRSANRVPYAHFDIKPANLMIADNGRIVLMDFGSCKLARWKISSRLQALQMQDEAAEQSTMPYRAPELFDCPSTGSIDEKVDIWSFGCLLYALLYGHSPFETAQTASGSIALAVLNCQYTFPSGSPYAQSDELHEIIRSCLNLVPNLRPSAADLGTRLTRLHSRS